MKRLYYFPLALLSLAACTPTGQPVMSSPQWEQQASGVWQTSVGRPEKINLRSELNIQPKWDVINAMPTAELPFDKKDIKFEEIDGKTYIRFPLDKDEKIYGLGLNFKTINQRGRIHELHVDHYGGKDNGRTHAPVPFFVSSKGYGAFINSARYLKVYLTGLRKDAKHPATIYNRNTDADWQPVPYSDNLEILVPAEGVEVVLFAGENMLDVVRRFNLYNGGGTLPPKWGLGFWQRVHMMYSDEDVKKEVAEFQKRGFPLSVIGLEPGWMSHSYPCSYQWDPTRYPNPKQFVEDLLHQNVRTNLWFNPGISPASEIYESIKPYTGSHMLWNGLVADYTIPEACNIIQGHFKKNMTDIGVSGYKMDENDGYDFWLWPDLASFPSGIAAEQIRQIYGSLIQRTFSEIYREKNERTYGLVRSGNAGTSSFPFVLYNDYYDHRDFITALINSSFIGVLWSPEARETKTSEELLRRIQSVCFSPLAMINAWADGTKPWTFAEVEKQVKEVTLLRMQLIPYFYTAFADYAFNGTPPMRAMNLESGFTAKDQIEKGKWDSTDNPYVIAIKKESKDQFMAGENLLVAPMFAGEKERDVILPQGKWFDFYTGEYVGDGEIITVKPDLDRIPLFVKDGGIIPLWPPITQVDESKYPLEIRHYGSKPGSYDLYDDDGKTYNYEKGEYTYMTITVDVDSNGNKKGNVSIPEGKKVWSYNGEYTFRFMTK